MGNLHWSKQASVIFLLWAATAFSLSAQTFTTLHSFDGTDGADSYAGLIQATDGSFYGTTFYGGSNYDCPFGSCGTIFKITPSGTLITLHNFNATDGADPSAAPVQGTDGNFYGTTTFDGAGGYGTVYKVTPGGTLTTLHNFKGGSDGGQPYFVTLIQATDGNFYGTTEIGGANVFYGTVFKITPSGKLTTLHSFDGTDGAYPLAGLVQGTDGNFYGTTSGNGSGTIFKITPTGKLTTLHIFDGTDGAGPRALLRARDGNFYGTTPNGSYTSSYGTMFEITPTGAFTTLLIFDGSDGSAPAALVQGTDGNFYGTTGTGGANNSCEFGCGTLFEITPGGALTTLYNFCSQGARHCSDGSLPFAGVIQATDGNLYGTTSEGGAHGYGTVFSLSVDLGPFVETQPTSGPVGAAVNILGTNLTGATSVTFNGVAAAFTVVSESLITTTVPPGASSGRVHVVGPRGTLKSNLPFRVKP